MLTVTNMQIKVAAASPTATVGAAIHGAIAAGKEEGGYTNIEEAANRSLKLKLLGSEPLIA